MRFEQKIEWLMRERGLNQETLASSLNLSQSTVSRWLNGAKPHRRIALNIAIFFNVDVESLLDDNLDLPPGHMPPEEYSETPPYSPEVPPSKNLKISKKGGGMGDELMEIAALLREAAERLEKYHREKERKL